MSTTRTIRCRNAMLFAAFLLATSWLTAAENEGKPWWPQFHGPNRDNMSSDTGLLKQWPDGGPPLLWKSSECGSGYSMISIADDKIFTVGDFDEVEMVVALDMDGRLLWKARNGKSWTGPYPGSRTTPTYDDGLLFHMNPTGKLTAFQAATGAQVWSVDLKEEFGARYGTWAMSENILVDGDKLFCVPGGRKGLVVALDKRTGRTVWANTALDEVAAYCSPILVDHNGQRQLITMTQRSVIGVAVDSGKLLWSHPHPTPNDQNINRPIFHDGCVLVASGHRGGSRLIRIDPQSTNATEVWADRDLDNCHGGIMLLDGYLYGSACRSGGKDFFCAEFLTGKTTQTDRSLGKLSLTYADGKLYGLDHRGRMLLMSVAPGSFTVESEFRMPHDGFGLYLAHPIVCGGRLYLRHNENLYAFDVRGEL